MEEGERMREVGSEVWWCVGLGFDMIFICRWAVKVHATNRCTEHSKGANVRKISIKIQWSVKVLWLSQVLGKCVTCAHTHTHTHTQMWRR